MHDAITVLPQIAAHHAGQARVVLDHQKSLIHEGTLNDPRPARIEANRGWRRYKWRQRGRSGLLDCASPVKFCEAPGVRSAIQRAINGRRTRALPCVGPFGLTNLYLAHTSQRCSAVPMSPIDQREI